MEAEVNLYQLRGQEVVGLKVHFENDILTCGKKQKVNLNRHKYFVTLKE